MLANRLLWVLIIIALVFIIFGIISFFRQEGNMAILLFWLWFLNMVLLVLFTYYALLIHPHWFIWLLYFIILLFSTCWACSVGTDYANFSLIIVLIFSLALIYLSHTSFYALSILYLLSWLFLFFYSNQLLK